jgi:hypothetical protein
MTNCGVAGAEIIDVQLDTTGIASQVRSASCVAEVGTASGYGPIGRVACPTGRRSMAKGSVDTHHERGLLVLGVVDRIQCHARWHPAMERNHAKR